MHFYLTYVTYVTHDMSHLYQTQASLLVPVKQITAYFDPLALQHHHNLASMTHRRAHRLYIRYPSLLAGNIQPAYLPAACAPRWRTRNHHAPSSLYKITYSCLERRRRQQRKPGGNHDSHAHDSLSAHGLPTDAFSSRTGLSGIALKRHIGAFSPTCRAPAHRTHLPGW